MSTTNEGFKKPDFKANLNALVHKVTTKEGFLGNYDYASLFTPKIPFLKQQKKIQPFFGLDADIPLFLGFILGLQHALSMLAGLSTPPILLSNFVNLDDDITQYMVSCSLIISGLLSAVQITRFHIPFTPYYLGTGLISVVGTSFATISIAGKAFPMMYTNGKCPTADDGTQLPCPDGFGALLGTSACCALLEIAMSFMPPAILQKIFPPIVTGPVVMLIGVSLIGSGFQNFCGGSCTTCAKGLPWGSAEFIGLGFLVYVTIIICEKWGSPIMKSCAVICGLLMGCIVAAACGYFSRASIDAAPVATFPWVHTFKLSVYGPLVLPMLACYIILMMEAIGDITASCDVSRVEIEGPIYESRIQGGVLADGLNGCLAALMTMTPVSTFAQNNGVISITKCASRTVGYWCCFFLVVMGVFSKFAAALVAIPPPVLGGMTSFLFTAVAVSGLRIIASTPFTRRDRFVLTCSLMFGYGATLVEGWFDHVFTYSGDNESLQGFLDAIVLVLETEFAITGIIGVILNLFIPQEFDNGDEADELIDEHVIEESTSSSSPGKVEKV